MCYYFRVLISFFLFSFPNKTIYFQFRYAQVLLILSEGRFLVFVLVDFVCVCSNIYDVYFVPYKVYLFILIFLLVHKKRMIFDHKFLPLLFFFFFFFSFVFKHLLSFGTTTI